MSFFADMSSDFEADILAFELSLTVDNLEALIDAPVEPQSQPVEQAVVLNENSVQMSSVTQSDEQLLEDIPGNQEVLQQTTGDQELAHVLFDEDFISFADIGLPDFAASSSANIESEVGNENTLMADIFSESASASLQSDVSAISSLPAVDMLAPTVQDVLVEFAAMEEENVTERPLVGTSFEVLNTLLLGSLNANDLSLLEADVLQIPLVQGQDSGNQDAFLVIHRISSPPVLTPQQTRLKEELLGFMRETALTSPEKFAELVTSILAEVETNGSSLENLFHNGVSLVECMEVVRSTVDAPETASLEQRLAYRAAVRVVGGEPEKEDELESRGGNTASSSLLGDAIPALPFSQIGQQVDLELERELQLELERMEDAMGLDEEWVGLDLEGEESHRKRQRRGRSSSQGPRRAIPRARQTAPQRRAPLAARGTQGSPNTPGKRVFSYGIESVYSSADVKYGITPATTPPDARAFSALAGTYAVDVPVKINRTRYTRDNLDVLLAGDPTVRYDRNPFFDREKPYQQEWTRVELDPTNGLPFNTTRAGLCPYCSHLNFQNIKNSSYAQHLATNHGIFSNGLLMPLPYGYGEYPFDGRHIRMDPSFTARTKGVFCPGCDKPCRVNCWNILEFLTNYMRHYKNCSKRGVDIRTVLQHKR